MYLGKVFACPRKGHVRHLLIPLAPSACLYCVSQCNCLLKPAGPYCKPRISRTQTDLSMTRQGKSPIRKVLHLITFPRVEGESGRRNNLVGVEARGSHKIFMSLGVAWWIDDH